MCLICCGLFNFGVFWIWLLGLFDSCLDLLFILGLDLLQVLLVLLYLF